jgi:hypothetical protein
MKEDPLILPFSPRGEGTLLQAAEYSLSPPYPLADMAFLSGKLAKASLLGEDRGEGVS